MNAKLWACVIAGVLVAHLCVLVIVSNIRLSRTPRPKPVEPNFSASTTTYTAPDGKILKMEHAFTVETEFAKPELLEKLPPPPLDTAQPAKYTAPATAE